ncbi:MAG: M14 family metallopeptidase, partial [Planctomycetota bacterium]
VSTFGKSEEGRNLLLVRVSDPPLADEKAVLASQKLRLLVNANIHAGEVEGKEAVQMLLRELARGEHGDLLDGAVLYLVPIYNADGNERIDRRNRVAQNGPSGGVGQRPNAEGLDLNRDFVKAESAECRALLSVFNRVDPQLFMDLHTTNGSYHGYHLTYSPSLSTNVDPELDAYSRTELLPRIRARMLAHHGLRVFDYGNFYGESPSRGWRTYDHRPRFGTNYFGLRNRISVLSEAYSYLSFQDRVRVTRAFVIETLKAAVEQGSRIRKLCAAADARAKGREGLRFGYATRLQDPVEGEILVGSIERERIEDLDAVRLVAGESFEARSMQVQVAFRSRQSIPLPEAWALRAVPEAVRELLLLHGLEVGKLERDTKVEAEVFVPREIRRRRRPFQKHHERSLRGAYVKRALTLPAGSMIVSSGQRLARVAAQLLEAVSEDSLATWNFLDALLEEGEDGKLPEYPVIRIIGGEELATIRLR